VTSLLYRSRRRRSTVFVVFAIHPCFSILNTHSPARAPHAGLSAFGGVLQVVFVCRCATRQSPLSFAINLTRVKVFDIYERGIAVRVA
jgi:hypothetical protein